MKLDSSIIKQLIKEELQNLLQERPAKPPCGSGEEASWIKQTERSSGKWKCIKSTAAPAPVAAPKKTAPKKPVAKKAEPKKAEPEAAKSEQPSMEDCQGGVAPKWQCNTLNYPHPTDFSDDKKDDKKEEKKSTFTREQGRLRRKINQLKKDGKIDEKTWRAARKALYKGTDAANAVLQKAGVGGRAPGGPRTASAGDAGGQYRRAQQPMTPQENATAVRLWDAVQTLIAEKHPQLRNIWRAIVRAAQGGHKIARVVVGEMADQRKRDQKIRDRRTQVTQATQTRPGVPGLS